MCKYRRPFPDIDGAWISDARMYRMRNTRISFVNRLLRCAQATDGQKYRESLHNFYNMCISACVLYRVNVIREYSYTAMRRPSSKICTSCSVLEGRSNCCAGEALGTYKVRLSPSLSSESYTQHPSPQTLQLLTSSSIHSHSSRPIPFNS